MPRNLFPAKKIPFLPKCQLLWCSETQKIKIQTITTTHGICAPPAKTNWRCQDTLHTPNCQPCARPTMNDEGGNPERNVKISKGERRRKCFPPQSHALSGRSHFSEKRAIIGATAQADESNAQKANLRNVLGKNSSCRQPNPVLYTKRQASVCFFSAPYFSHQPGHARFPPDLIFHNNPQACSRTGCRTSKQLLPPPAQVPAAGHLHPGALVTSDLHVPLTGDRLIHNPAVPRLAAELEDRLPLVETTFLRDLGKVGC